MIHQVRIDDDHKYWIPGTPSDVNVPGYTEISRSLGIIQDNPFYTDQGREEGIALHKWLRFLAQGKTPKSAPDPRIAGRVRGIQKFISDTGFKIVGGEEPRYEPSYRYACTPDLWGQIGNWSWIIDAKRGAKMKSHALQTAAQAVALKANDFRTQKRGALYLKDNDYRLDEHTNAQDVPRWLNFVSAFHAKGEYI